MQFLLYCLCGGIGVATDYAVFWLAVTGGLWYQAANASYRAVVMRGCYRGSPSESPATGDRRRRVDQTGPKGEGV